MYGITAIYDALSKDVTAALELRKKLVRKSMPLERRWMGTATIRMMPTARTPERLQQRLLAAARPADAGSEFFRVVTEPYWAQALAVHLYAKHELSDKRVRDLEAIHESRTSGWRLWANVTGLKGVTGVLAAIAAFLASQVPKESFANLHVGAAAYGWYRFGIAVSFVGLLIYVLMLRLATWPARAKVQRAVAVQGLVLAYCGMNEVAASAARRPAPEAPHTPPDTSSPGSVIDSNPAL